MSDIYLSDSGFTIGMGIEYANNNNLMDFSFKFGKRDSEYISKENYFNFTFSMTSSENWFDREKEK